MLLDFVMTGRTKELLEEIKPVVEVASNCRFDGATLYTTYRKPFDVIFERAKSKEWCALRDDFRTFFAQATWSTSPTPKVGRRSVTGSGA